MGNLTKKYLKAFSGFNLAILIFLISFLIENTSWFKKGCIIGFAEPLVEWLIALTFYRRHIQGVPHKQNTAALYFFFFLVFLGVGDFFYALFYYGLGISSKTWYATFLTTNLYVVSYILGSLSMMAYSAYGVRNWFKDYRNWLPYLITLPLAFRLMYTPFLNAFSGDGFNYYVFIEVIGVLTTLVLISTSMRVLVNARDSFWEWMSSGLVSLVLCDWALRVEKLAFGEPLFGFYEYLYYISVLICAMPILFIPSKPTLIESSETKSLSSSYKLYTLFAVFISLLFLTLSQYGSRDAIRLTSIGCVLGCLVSVYVSKFMVKEIQNFSSSLTSIAGLLLEGKNHEFAVRRKTLPVELIETVDFVVQKQITDERERSQLKQSLALQMARVEIANQVAHDIRSPLSALDVSLMGIKDLPEERRVLARSAITRIKDIANNLLSKNSVATDLVSNYLLSPLIESILSEKRFQFRHFLNISIEFQASEENYGIFANVNPPAFKRIISNIINNSTEAIEDKMGLIKVGIFRKNGKVSILISDNGRGIPAKLIPELGQKGATFGKSGKESGSGLGLYYAKTTLQSWDGTLEVESIEGKETTIKITLPEAAPPLWFVDKITIADNSQVVIVDDDLSIHQVWDRRIQIKKPNLHISSAADFETWIRSKSENQSTLFLIDYEFFGEAQNGLDLISKYNLFNNSILVSSRLEEAHVQKKIETLNVKALPKSTASFVPIKINS